MIDEDTGEWFALLTGDDHLYDVADFVGLWFGPLALPDRPN